MWRTRRRLGKPRWINVSDFCDEMTVLVGKGMMLILPLVPIHHNIQTGEVRTRSVDGEWKTGWTWRLKGCDQWCKVQLVTTLRDYCWGQHFNVFTSFVADRTECTQQFCGLYQTEISVSLLEGKLLCLETWTGWRTEQSGILWRSALGNAKSCTGLWRNNPIHECWLAGEQHCRERSGGPWWTRSGMWASSVQGCTSKHCQ